MSRAHTARLFVRIGGICCKVDANRGHRGQFSTGRQARGVYSATSGLVPVGLIAVSLGGNEEVIANFRPEPPRARHLRHLAESLEPSLELYYV